MENITDLSEQESDSVSPSEATTDSNEKKSCCKKCFLNLKKCKFHSIIVFLILLSLLGLFTQMVQGGYMPAIVTDLQTQFNLSTSKIGLILSSFDIMGVFATPFLSFIGSKYNKCRILAVTGIIYAIGLVLFTLPYYIGEKYTISSLNYSNLTGNMSDNIDYCKSSVKNSSITTSVTMTTSTLTKGAVEGKDCTRDLANNLPYAIFITSQMVMSIGAAPLFPLGITFLCDNLDERLHALFTGIVYGAFALGPAAGYLLASLLLSKWVYLDQKAPVSESDPRWVGSWFLGFLIASVLVLIISFMLLTFPDAIHDNAKAKKAERKNRKKSKQSQKSNLETIIEQNELPLPTLDSQESQFSNLPASSIPTPVPEKKKTKWNKKFINKISHSRIKFKNFLTSLFRLILNLRYVLIVLIMSIECILIALFTNYMVLYTQNVYQVSSSISSILVGGVVVPSAILGSVVGGFIVKKFNLFIEGCVRLIIASSCITLGGIFVLLFVRCETAPSVGIDETNQTFNKSFVSCNQDCGCLFNYNPVCGNDGNTYVSPCYAGCKSIKDEIASKCDCILNKPDGTKVTPEAKFGRCSKDCDKLLVVFLIVAFVTVFAESLSITPATMLILQIIDKPLQPFALGLLRVANILLAFIPAPIVLSQVIDTTCILWNNPCVGDKGTCLEYKSSNFHYVLFGSAAGIKVASGIVLIIFSLYVHKTFILRRRYRSKATLNHDPSFVHTSKQKYMIDSEIASTDSSSINSDDVGSLKSLYRKKRTLKPLKRDESIITLNKHVIFDDSYSLTSQNGLAPNEINLATDIRQNQNQESNELATSNF